MYGLFVMIVMGGFFQRPEYDMYITDDVAGGDLFPSGAPSLFRTALPPA